MTNGNDPINPSPINANYSTGLTKREYFAALAMQALIGAMPDISEGERKLTPSWAAVEYADRLIKELNTSVRASAFMEHLNDKKQNPGMRGGFAEEP